jgi:hypothetical protein
MMHRYVGPAQQYGSIVAMRRGDGQANAGTDIDRVALHQKRFV